jgi:predicted nucleotidyltransferase
MKIEKTLNDVKKIISANEQHLRQFGVKEIYVFGSVARGEAKETSDIDFFVVLDEGVQIGFLRFVELELFLSEKLNAKVDLGTKKSLHPLLRDQILREAIRVA